MNVVVGNKSECDMLQAIINKALNCPRIGAHVGGGLHVLMPDTWDGVGACPLGWTKDAVLVLNGSTDSLVVLPDNAVADLAKPAAQAKLTPVEKTAVTNAVASRVEKDLTGYDTANATTAEEANL